MQRIVVLSAALALTACASAPYTSQQILEDKQKSVNSAYYSVTDEERGLSVVIPRRFWIETDSNGGAVHSKSNAESGISSALDAAKDYTYQTLLTFPVSFDSAFNSSCFIDARLYNTSNNNYHGVKVTISGNYVNSLNRWEGFYAERNLGDILPINSEKHYDPHTPTTFRITSGTCPTHIKDIQIKIKSCIDVAVGDRRCQ